MNQTTMTKKVFILLFVAMVTVSIFSIKTLQVDTYDHDHYSILMIENVEALANDNESGKGFSIEPYECVVTGVAQVKLGDGKIIKAKADGTITISGAQNCKMNGEYLCEPITCDKLYSTIF